MTIDGFSSTHITSRKSDHMKTIRLPIPPSINSAYRNRTGGKGKGRLYAQATRTWLAAADAYTLAAGANRGKPAGQATWIVGRWALTIRLPHDFQYDITNRIKLIEDGLVSREFVEDDKKNDDCRILRDPGLGLVNFCEVDIYGPEDEFGVGEPWIQEGKP
jgi:hypothetical protein